MSRSVIRGYWRRFSRLRREAASADYEHFLKLNKDEADAGIGEPCLPRFETGRRQGTLDTLRAIAQTLDAQPDVLIAAKN